MEVAAGLGSYIVDGGKSFCFSPKHPSRVLQTSTVELTLRDTHRLSSMLCPTRGGDLRILYR